MKKMILFLHLSAFLSAGAQVAINKTAALPHQSAMLDISATNKGLLIPRLTTAQRTSIAPVVKGLLVYDSTTNSVWYHDGTAWQEQVSGLNTLWKTGSDGIYPNGAAAVGIGTAALHPTAMLHVELGTSESKGFLVSGGYQRNATVPNLGAGSRLMFYPGKAAFRAGSVDGDQWNDGNVGYYSTATGYKTIASGFCATAIGWRSVASERSAIALGEATIASGENAAAIGYNAKASGLYAIALGPNSIASGYGALALGSSSTASGSGAVTFGFGATASGIETTAIGTGSEAKGSYSHTLGFYTTANGAASTVVGLFNDPILSSPEQMTNPTTPLFIVGNGSVDNRSNAMVILKNGNIGIGTNPTASRLTLKGGTGDAVTIQGGGDVRMWSDDGASNARLFVLNNGSGADAGLFTIRSDGKTFSFNGTGGSVSSDVRLKRDILPLRGSLQKLLQLNGYSYRMKTKAADPRREIGVLAQEVQKVLPEAVFTDGDGMYAVSYTSLIPLLIDGVKEQQAQVEKLRRENEELKRRLDAIERALLPK